VFAGGGKQNLEEGGEVLHEVCLKNIGTGSINVLFYLTSKFYNMSPSSNLFGLGCTFPISSATLPRTPGRIPPGSLKVLVTAVLMASES